MRTTASLSSLFLGLALLQRVSAYAAIDTTVTGETCVDMSNYGGSYVTATEQCESYNWCATSESSSGSYASWAYCGYGNNNEDECVPMIYSGVSYDNCTAASTSGWCAIATYSDLSYYSYKYCTAEDWEIPVDLGLTSCGDDGCTTVTGESCVSFTYGGVDYDNKCTDELYSWCATSTDSSGAYLTWAYCGFGDSNGDECTFPFVYGSSEYYGCTQNTYNGWCATSVYANTNEYASWKSCDSSDYFNQEYESVGYHDFGGNGTHTTVSGEYCVPFTYGGVFYDGTCYGSSYSWCATSTYDDGSYKTWAYCGYGNSNEDECVLPWVYNGKEYTTCTAPTSSGWCATSIYENERTYYSYKYCDEDEQALGYSTFSYGSGTTINGEDCVPMLYSGAYYTACNAESSYSWCATSTYDDGSYASWGYCGYGNNNEDTCVFPFVYSGVTYTTCTSGGSGWCATSVLDFTYAYYSYKYCDDEEAALGSTQIDIGSGTTVTGEECVPMIYSGVEYLACTSGSYSWCATEVSDSGSYTSWAYCGYGNSNEENCVYPFTYSGEEYYQCASIGSSPWCATSVYENEGTYYSYKSCNYYDLQQSGDTNSYGSGMTIYAEECVPMVYGGVGYEKCTSDTDSYSWCATEVNSAGSYSDWEYCGYGNGYMESCVPMIYSSTYYQNCTGETTSDWCATSAYENSQAYATWKYCTSDDWESDYEYICDDCETTVNGDYCQPFMYDGVLTDGCVSSPSWCATSVDSSDNYVTWDYCGSGDANGDECQFPFKEYSDHGPTYYTCTGTSTSDWCATSTYKDDLVYYSWKYCNEDELALGISTNEYEPGTTITGEECVPMIYYGVYYTKCTNDDYQWCATSVDSNQEYTSWAYCGYYNDDNCQYPYAYVYGGELYNECMNQDTANPWCATSTYSRTLDYATWKYCDESDLLTEEETSWGSSVDSEGCVFPFSYLGVTYFECATEGYDPWCATSVNTETGNYITWQYCEQEETTTTTESSAGTMQTFSGDSCVPMIYGGVYYEACTDDTYGWCATSTDSDLNYQTWGYCMLGDGENCYFPYKYGSEDYYECADKSSYSGYGWCATSTYTGGDYYDWKYCSATEAGYSASEYGSGTTITGEYCVPMTYGGVDYEGCTSDTYSWCATSTDSSGYYSTWAYCGYGNNNEDNCVYPFIYGGVAYTTCTDQTDSGWCATSVYENTQEYASWKYCDDEDKALGTTSVSYGEGTTVTGEECVPMIYGGVDYEACTSDTYSWCATEVNSAGSYSDWEYCGYGNSNEENCVPMIYGGVDYEGCTASPSNGGWCATSAYENTKEYYSWKYCEDSDWEETTSNAGSETGYGNGYETGYGTTVTGEDCVPMTYGGVDYEGCTTDDKYGWCATSTDSSGSYSTWAYCGYGNSYGDECYYPFYYYGETYYECADQGSSYAWCATSVYQETYDYYSYKYCDSSDLGTDSNTVAETFDGTDCVPVIYSGTRYEGCIDAGSYSWCATSTYDDLSYKNWDYCGYGDSESCYYPFTYYGETYYQCAGQDSSYAWCATSTYLAGNYYNWKYCDDDDLASGSTSAESSETGYSSYTGSESTGSSEYDYEYSSEESGETKTVSGETCVFPFFYDGEYYYECTTKDFGSIAWCATEIADDYSVIDWNYCKSSGSSSSSSSSESRDYGSDEDESVYEYKSLECSKKMDSQTLVWLNSPGDPIELTSPNYPNDFDISDLDCEWLVQARFGTKVKITFVEADMGEDCELDSLTVYDTSSGLLEYPGLSSQCGDNEFPASYDKVISDGPVTVKFESQGTSGTSKFKIVVEATEPDCDALESQPSPYELCPNGPCCSGDDCCIVSLGEYSELITSPNYPDDSGRNLSCAWTLQAPEGYMVSLNFLDMQMRQDTGSLCDNDYVKIADPSNSAHSIFSSEGTSFCGELLPNYPAPSVFTSSHEKLVLEYVTDVSNINRGRGFSAVASAINPLCTSISYHHKYDDNVCEATCDPHVYPTSPPEPVCYPVELTVFIIEANTTIPISGATVDIYTISNGIELEENPYWVAPAQVDVTRYTNLDGSITQEVTETGSYSIIVSDEDYFAHTVTVNITCEDVEYCGDCKPIAIIELEPVPEAACPDITTEVKVTDKDTEEPITGAKVTVTYQENNETYYAVEDILTDDNGEVSFDMTPVTEYTIYIEKEPYFSFNETVDAMCDSANCSACLDVQTFVELEKPECEDVTMTIHVRHNYTDEPVEGAEIKVINLWTDEVVTNETLITDEDGAVEAPIPMDGDYEVVVIHDDFINQDKIKSVDCDEMECELCAPVIAFNLSPNPDPVICNKEGFIVVSLSDEYTDNGVEDATITYKLLANGNTRLEDQIIGEDVPTNEDGDTKLRVVTNGMYEIDITHPGYEEVETKFVEVYCSEDEDEECVCEWPLEHQLTQAFCDDAYLNVVIVDSLTDEAVEDAIVNITLIDNYEQILTNGVTDQFGAVSALIEGSALFMASVSKEGFTSVESYTYIYCAVDACDECSQTLYLTIEPEQGCEEDMYAEITVIDELTQEPIEDAKVTITLISFANGAADENVGGDLTTDEEGKVNPELFYDGNYTVLIEHDDYLDFEKGFELNTYEDCENPILNVQLTPIEPANCEPIINITVIDNATYVPIPLALVNLTLTLNELVDGTYDQLVGETIYTDEDGVILYQSLAYGNMSATVSAEGYYSNEGQLEVVCDGWNCDSCQLTLVVELEEINCPTSEITITIKDELTQEPISDAEVTFTLTSTPETGETYLEYPTNTTNEDGVVVFPLEHMGNYTITVEKEGYDPVEVPTSDDCDPENCEACLPMEEIVIKKTFCDNVNFALWAFDPSDNSPMVGAIVDVVVLGYEDSLQSVGQFYVDETGMATIPIEGDGTYLYDITMEGYATTSESIVIDLAEMTEDGENCDLMGLILLSKLSVAQSPECEDAETQGFKVSLGWGETPDDLDLYTYRVSAEDPEDYCLAYYCDEKELCACMEFNEDVQDASGVESITFCCNEPEYYMIYVDDVSGKGSSMKNSGAKIQITANDETKSVATVKSEDVPEDESEARYWLAGCMLIENQIPKFTLVDKYFEFSPKEVDPLYCYNLFNELLSEDEPDIPTYIEVKNGVSGLPINGASVRLVSTDGEVRAYEETTNTSGETILNIDEPGTYKVVATSTGYIPDADYLEITCAEDSFEDCEAHITIELMPETDEGTVELTLDWDGETGPKDLDLFTLQVDKTDTSFECKTTSLDTDSCTGIKQTADSQDGSLGGESAILYNVDANSKYTYTVIAKKYGDESIFESSARLTVSDGTEATTVELDESQAEETPGAEYWLVGCVGIVGESFTFISVNKFYETDPTESLKLYCTELLESGAGSSTTPAPFCDNAKVSINVYDAVTFEAVDAYVGMSLIEDDTVSIVADYVQTENGVASVSIYSNGVYNIEVSAYGYVADSDDLQVSCDVDDCSSCENQVYVTLSPVIDDSTVRIMLGWGEMPNNWDLKTLQTNLEDEQDECVTDSENDCVGTTGPVDQDNSYGAETLDVTSSSYVYLVYVKNSCGVPYSTVDASHITITDGYDTKKSYLPVEYYDHETFWIIGCVRFTTDSYEYYEINVFQSEDPAEDDNEMNSYCYDLMSSTSYVRAAVTEEVDVKVTVEDPSTGEKVVGAQVTTSLSSDDSSYSVTTYTDEDGVTYIPVYSNGDYEVIFYLSGYVETKWSFFVDCYDDWICNLSYKASVVSSTEDVGDVRIVTEWDDNDEFEIESAIFVLDYDETGCTTTKDSTCESVEVEYYDSNTLSALIEYSTENDYNSYMVYLDDSSNQGADFLYSKSQVLVTDSEETNIVKMRKTSMKYNSASQALLFGGWRTKQEVDEMSDEEKRNTLIVELEKITSYSIEELQELSTNGELESLVGIAAISVFLESRLIRSTDELYTMTYEEQRNTLIADLNVNANYDVSYMQGLGDFDVVTLGLISDAYDKREIRAGSYGQSYWIVGCLSVINGTTRFAAVNEFSNVLPEEKDKLLCHDILEVYETASGLSQFWKNKELSIVARDAVDNTKTSVCADVYFEKEEGDSDNRKTVATDVCGYEIDIPLKTTGSGNYILHFSSEGYIGYSKEITVDEDDCNSVSKKCNFYFTISPDLESEKTRVMLSWDESVEGLDFAVYQVDSKKASSEEGCKLNTLSEGYCEDGSVVKDVANILDGSVGGTTYTIEDSNYLTYLLYAKIPEKMSEVDSVPSTADEILLFAGWRTQSEIDEMSEEDKRNTIIVEYNKVSSVSISILQSVSQTSQLVDASIVATFLMKWNIKTAEELKEMDYTDQQNALIDAFLEKGVSIYDLDGIYGAELVEAGLDKFTSEYINYNSISLMITNGEETEVSDIPTVTEGDNYWIIGCLEASSSEFTFVKTDLFIENDPLEENSRYCYNLFEDAKKESFPDEAYIEVIAYSAYDNTPAMGATVNVGPLTTTSQNSAYTDDEGVAKVPVYANGEYLVVVYEDGFEYNYHIVEIDCSDDSTSCSKTVQVSLSPSLEDGQSMITLNWGSDVEDMNLKMYYVDAYNSEEYSMADEYNQDGIFNAEYIINTFSYSDMDGLNGAKSVFLTGLDELDSVSYMVTAYNEEASEMAASNSLVTVTNKNGLGINYLNKKWLFEESMKGVLVFGEWSTISEIFNADEEDQRNTLIVELASWSSNTVSELQALSDEELIMNGAVTAFLKIFGGEYSTQSVLQELNFGDQWNVFLYLMSSNESVLATFRIKQANAYLTSGDLEMYYNYYCEGCTKVSIIQELVSLFSREAESKEFWIAGCIGVQNDEVQWIEVGEFVSTIDPFFCHNILFFDFVAEEPEPEFYEGVGLDIKLRNSQDNSAISNGYISVGFRTEEGMDIVAEEVAVSSEGEAFIEVHSNGIYSIAISADGFIDADFEMEVQCTSADCENKKLVSMSPELEAGETRIMLTWDDAPSDIDIHIISVKKSDKSSCRTYYGNKSGCEKISLDLDNTSGGQNGAETMTLLDNAINQDYVYVIGIEDYNFESSGTPFLESGATVTITNGVKTVYKNMVADSVSYSEEFYLFGCVNVTSDGDYTFIPAPEGTFFAGHDESKWVDMYEAFCS